MKRSNAPAPCPCGSGHAYAACCGVYHDGLDAPDAETLMRSRYSAYALAREDYLLHTWHPSTRPATLDLEHDAVRWIGLDIRRHGALTADTAFVEFVARYKSGGRAHRLHEISRFVREDGRWTYVDGQFPAADV